MFLRAFLLFFFLLFPKTAAARQPQSSKRADDEGLVPMSAVGLSSMVILCWRLDRLNLNSRCSWETVSCGRHGAEAVMNDLGLGRVSCLGVLQLMS